jgi:hypothetical protein
MQLVLRLTLSLVVGEVELNLGLPREEEKNDWFLIREKMGEGE